MTAIHRTRGFPLRRNNDSLWREGCRICCAYQSISYEDVRIPPYRNVWAVWTSLGRVRVGNFRTAPFSANRRRRSTRPRNRICIPIRPAHCSSFVLSDLPQQAFRTFDRICRSRDRIRNFSFCLTSDCLCQHNKSSRNRICIPRRCGCSFFRLSASRPPACRTSAPSSLAAF